MIYRGKVTATTSTGAYAIVTELHPTQAFGPLSCVGAVPAVGDIVLVVEVGDTGSSLPDLVVVNPTTKTQLDAKVAGPASSTDNAIARYDGTTGKVVQDSTATISDAGALTVSGNVTASKTTATELKVQSTNDEVYLTMNPGSGGVYFDWNKAGSARWSIRTVSGNTFVIRRTDDTPTSTDAVAIARTSGRVTLGTVTSSGGLEMGSSGPRIMAGADTPEGAVSAPIGSLWLRTDGGAGTTLYVKESGTGNTGWVAK